MPLHDKLKIAKKKGQFVSGKSDLFAVVIALRYLIGNEDFKKRLQGCADRVYRVT